MFRFLLAFVVVSQFCGSSKAGFILSVGNVTLQANTANQAVDVSLLSTSAADPALKGMELNVHLGNDNLVLDGMLPFEGVFNGSQLSGSTFFWSTISTEGTTGPVMSAAAVIQANVTFNDNASFAVGENVTVKVATLRIDTTGLTPGTTYGIILNDQFGALGGASRLVDLNTNNPGLTITNGSFTIAVPEPSSAALVLLAAVCVGSAKRFRKSVLGRK